MALIIKDNFIKLEKERTYVHKKASATYTTFVENGDKYFEIDTYGSSNRELKGKLSQTIQIDEAMAKELVRLLVNSFDIELD